MNRDFPFFTALIILVLAALVALCLASFIRRLSGKKRCCGGETKRMPAKKLDRVFGTFTVRIAGMHCARCKESVTQAVNALPGYAAKVDLARSEAVVSCENAPDVEAVKLAIAGAGFIATSVSEVEKK